MISLNHEQCVAVEWRSRRGLVVSVLLECCSWNGLWQLEWSDGVEVVRRS
jgi:hypothetical protein